jgi:hypothetical protein
VPQEGEQGGKNLSRRTFTTRIAHPLLLLWLVLTPSPAPSPTINTSSIRRRHGAFLVPLLAPLSSAISTPSRQIQPFAPLHTHSRQRRLTDQRRTKPHSSFPPSTNTMGRAAAEEATTRSLRRRFPLRMGFRRQYWGGRVVRSRYRRSGGEGADRFSGGASFFLLPFLSPS